MEDFVISFLISLGVVLLIMVIAFAIKFPIFGIAILTLIVLYWVLSRIFPGFIHGKTVYGGNFYVLSNERFKYYKGHTKYWNLKGCNNYRVLQEELYVQKTWNPHYCIELATGKVLPVRLDWFLENFFFAKTMFVSIDLYSVNNPEIVKEYLTSKDTASFVERIKSIEQEAKKTYLEAKMNPMETNRQKIQKTIKEYRIHKREEK